MSTVKKQLLALFWAAAFLSGCASRAPVSIELQERPPCDSASGVIWAGPNQTDHRERLSDWCRSVGPVIVRAPALHTVDIATTGLIIVNWNQHEDYGDLERLLRSLIGSSPVVALVQEVARASDAVPLKAPPSVRVPQRINPPGPMKRDIIAIAEELNLSLAYLPSMPNGARTMEDRGCAILSTLPITDVLGMELPWVRQRRVAVMGTLTAAMNGVPWRVRVVSTHLDNRSGRSVQAAALADFLEDENFLDLPIVIGGDLNTWHGIEDAAVHEINRVVPLIPECGKEATFRFGLLFRLRLDHFFTTLPEATRIKCLIEKDRYGSDHHPIVLHLFKNSIP